MLPEEAALLDRVCADPDDDGPRLVFADWLDERNDPRGEFIRVQVALARVAARGVVAPDESFGGWHAPGRQGGSRA